MPEKTQRITYAMRNGQPDSFKIGETDIGRTEERRRELLTGSSSALEIFGVLPAEFFPEKEVRSAIGVPVDGGGKEWVRAEADRLSFFPWGKACDDRPTVIYELICPDKAKQILENCKYPRQRPIRDNHVAYLAKMMKTGEWIAYHDPITLFECTDDRQTYLVNGQHRLRALIQSYTSQHFMLVYARGNHRTLDLTYAAYDTHTKRTQGDQCRALNVESVFDNNLTMADKATAACKYIIAGGPASGRNAESRATPNQAIEFLLNECLEDAQHYLLEVLGSTQNSVLVSQPVLALALRLYRKASVGRDVIDDFFGGIDKGANLPAYDARNQFRPIVKTLEKDQRYPTFVKVWNEWRRGRHVRSVITPEPRAAKASSLRVVDCTEWW